MVGWAEVYGHLGGDDDGGGLLGRDLRQRLEVPELEGRRVGAQHGPGPRCTPPLG